MKAPVFTGSCVALVTPFKGNEIDYEKLGELVEYHVAHNTSAITVCGTTGEASTQNIPEHLEAIRYSVEKAAGRIKILAGTGSNDTAHALRMCQKAESFGADALLMVTPYYNKTTQHGLVKHYSYIADNVNIPIVLYNVPSRTGVKIGIDAYIELAKHPMINGVKEASGDFSLIAQLLSKCGDDLNVWSGNDDQTVAMMSLGAKGVISVAANIIPDVMVKMCDAALKGDFAQASKLQLKCIELMNALFIEVNPVPIKTAMNLLGFDVGNLRMPLCDMLPKNLESLKKALVNFGLELK